MKRFISFLLENYKHIITLILFLLAVFIILLIIPHQTRFKYEYQKGKPWLYETLIAPVDFPILKDNVELQKEKDSILKNAPLYYYRDKSKYERAHNNLLNDIENLKTTDTAFNKTSLINDCNNFLKILYFEPGIHKDNDSIFKSAEPKIIYISSDSTIEDYFNFRFKNILESKDLFIKLIEQKYPGFSQKLTNIDNYFYPNIEFDAQLTKQITQQLLNEISLTKGLVKKGEVIINKGEIISSEKYLILESLNKEFIRTSYNPYLIIGQFLTIALGLLMVFLFLYNFRQEILSHFTKTSFILSLIILFVFVAQKVNQWNANNIYLVPFTLLPIIIRSFYDSRLALFVHTITILIISYFLPNSFEFMFMQYMAGTTSVFVLINARRRGQLFLTAFLIFLTYSIIYFGISIVQTEDIHQIEWKNFTWFAINAIMLLSAYPLIYIFEKTFGFLSDVTLMELTDTNHPLLRMLAEKAPGTFQHSLQVANLSEEIIQKIGGNALLARVGALYHDIGKIELPHYFIENQHHIPNPHNELQVDKSLEIITGHVHYGMQIAKKHKLPKPIIEFIETHHGTSIIQYFYRTYKQEHPGEIVDKDMFRYKGNLPTTKETAVVMIVDSIEAASRSIKDFSDESLQKMIDNIINQKLEEQQLQQSPLTFKELRTIKEILIKRLKNIYHSRVMYPAD